MCKNSLLLIIEDIIRFINGEIKTIILDDFDESIFVNDVQKLIDDLQISESDFKTPKYDHQFIETREVFKYLFSSIGVELEFCGKAERERGVIIDIDDSVLASVGIHSNSLRLGNNVVRRKGDMMKIEKNNRLSESIEAYDELLRMLNLSVLQLIKRRSRI